MSTAAVPLTRALWACLAVLLAATAAASTHAETRGVRHEKIFVKAPFPMPPIKVPVFPKRDFVITDFGAKPGGQADNTEAIRKAIAACHKAGGGRVVIPAGEWLTGAVHSGGVRNVYVHDCRFDAQTEPFNLLYIKTNRRRGGFVENIVMENIEATSTRFGVFGIETDVLNQWRTLVPTYEERLTPIRGITVRNVRVGKTATPFRIVGDEREPVREVLLDNITIGTVRGQKNRYGNARNVKETNVRIGTYIEEPDQENRNE